VSFMLFFAINGFSQENQIKFDGLFDFERTVKINDDIDFVVLNPFNQAEDNVYKIDKSQNSKVLLNSIPSLSYNYNLLKFLGHETGMFYASRFYSNGEMTSYYNVNWLDINGDITSSDPFNFSPVLLGANADNLFYFKDNGNGGNTIEKYNKSTNIRTHVHTFEEEIEHYHQVDGIDYFVSRDDPNKYEFFSYGSSGVESKFSISSSRSYFTFLEEYNNLHYFYVYSHGNNGGYEVWEVDFTQNSAQLYAELPHYFNTNIAENSFYLSHYNGHYIGDLSSPNQIDTIPFSKELSENNPNIMDAVNRKIARGYTNKHGFESFYMSDSIYLLKNLAPGIQSGWINQNYNLTAGYSDNPFFIQNNGSDTCYSIMTNFNDNLNYLYSIKDSSVQSYFPIEDASYILKTEIYENNFYWWTKKKDTFTIHWRSLEDNLSPQPTEKIDSTELVWAINLDYVHERRFYVQNDRQQNAQIKLLKDGGTLSSTRMANASEYKISDENYNIIDDAYGCFLVYKHDSTGKLEWHKSFGPKHFGSWADNPLLVDIDENEDVYVSGVFFKNYNTNTDSLEINRAANFIHKLDGETGETIWFKIISQNYYYSDLHIDKLKIINNEIVLAFSYKDFKCTIDGFQLKNEFASPINAIAKFDMNGNLIYAKNIPTDWTSGCGGNTWILDEYNGQLFAGQSEGAYNIGSSCEFDKWGYFNQIIDKDGKVKKTISKYSSDIGSATAGFFEDNNIFAFGRYRGELDLGYFKNITPFGNNCNLSRGFMYRYDLEKDEFSELKISHEEFYPFDAKYLGDFYYVYGRGDNDELTIVKFDKNGNEIGYKRLGQYIKELSYNAYQFFDVSNKYIAIIGDQFQENAEFEVPRKSGTHRYTTVIKTLNDNWSNDKKLFWNTDRIFTSDVKDDLVIYPNPFTDEFSIMFKDPIFTDLEIYDLNGKQIKEFGLTNDFVQKFSFDNIPAGIYLFKIFNENKSKTIKMVKQ